MKNIIFVILILVAMQASSQEVNKIIEDPNRNKEVMINNCTREGLTNFEEFKASFHPNYEAYKPDSITLVELSKLRKETHVTIVLGTWCGDSKYQVPNFLKVADALQLRGNNITFIGVDGTKKAEKGLIDKLKIERVPTFIFTDKNGAEIGRITETPRETLEKDMLKILAVTKTK